MRRVRLPTKSEERIAKSKEALRSLRLALCSQPFPLCILPEVLANLLSPKRSDAVQTKAENHPILFSETDIERLQLGSY